MPGLCRQVLGLYVGREWAFIEEHLHSVLGARNREAGDPAGALEHFAAMLVCPHSPRAWQATYLRQFLDAVAAAAAAQVRLQCLGTGHARLPALAARVAGHLPAPVPGRSGRRGRRADPAAVLQRLDL